MSFSEEKIDLWNAVESADEFAEEFFFFFFFIKKKEKRQTKENFEIMLIKLASVGRQEVIISHPHCFSNFLITIAVNLLGGTHDIKLQKFFIRLLPLYIKYFHLISIAGKFACVAFYNILGIIVAWTRN